MNRAVVFVVSFTLINAAIALPPMLKLLNSSEASHSSEQHQPVSKSTTESEAGV